MEGEGGGRSDGRNANQLRPLLCTRGLLERAHGSARWSQGGTTVVAAVYGPRSVGGRKENPERATLEVIWKAKSGQAGNAEKEAELVIRRTLEYIVLTSMHPNTVAVSCAVRATDGVVVLDPTKSEEEKFPAHVSLVFLNKPKSMVPGVPSPVDGEPAERGILTSLTRGAMSVDEYFKCLERGRTASGAISDFARASLELCQRGSEMASSN